MKIHVLDGGFATEVLKHNLWSAEFSHMDDDPLWSSRLLQTHPDETKAVHLKFLLAGSDVIETNTYQASIEALKRHLSVTGDRASELIAKGVLIAKQAVDEFVCSDEFKSSGRERPRVAGSVGPYGVYLCDGSEYSGHYLDSMSIKALQDWHRPKIQALVSAGADLLALETIPGMKEAQALVGLMQEFPGVQAWLSFSCKDESHTCAGELFSSAVQVAAQSNNIVAVGINCTKPQYVTPLLKSAQGFRKDFIVYPNSGEEWVDKEWYGFEDCRAIHEYAPEWLDLGVRWIGGCCRVYSENIKQIRHVVTTYLK